MIPNWLPDWRDADAYPKANDTSLNQWAWEFLRRWPEYQHDNSTWQALGIDVDFIPTESGDAMSFSHCEPPAVDGETYGEYQQRCQGYRLVPISVYLGEKYGLDYLHDPASTSRFVRFATGVSPTYRINHGPERLSHHPDPEFPDIIDYGMLPEEVGEVVAKLNLNWPLPKQLARLKTVLLAAQKNLEKAEVIKVRSTRKRIGQFPIYLRILDAHASGLSVSELARAFFPTKRASGAERDDYQNARNYLEAAKRLRHPDYRYLLI